MTNQEAYEQIRTYLTRPGATRAFSHDVGGCAYEIQMDDLGIHRCAVGCLLSPGAITFLADRMALSGISAHEMFTEAEYYAPVLAELDGTDEDFLQCAQRIHDDRDSWLGDVFDVGMLDGLADQWGLRIVGDQPEAPVVVGEKVNAWAPRELVPA